jgi:hypothetical protein
MVLRKFILLAMGVGLFFGAAVGESRAEQPYLEQAISETGEAITAGKAQESASMIEHADRAFDRARSAVWRNPVDHIRQGIKSLRKAVKVAKGTNSPARITKALGFLETAKTHFEAAR